MRDTTKEKRPSDSKTFFKHKYTTSLPDTENRFAVANRIKNKRKP